MITATSTLADVAFAVCTALHTNGGVAVLTGGSAATYYAPDAYQSRDLDFLHAFDPCRERLASYLFWNDLSGLEQALAVHQARQSEVSLADLRAWARREGQAKKFELYEERARQAGL